MRALYSVIFWLYFVLSSAVFFVGAALLWLVTLPFDPNRKLLHLYSCFWAVQYFYVNPLWKLRVHGREKLPWNSAAVLVCNHQSLGDILAVFGLYSPFKWVSKQSVFSTPFLGWNMRLNRYVPLKRGDKESIAKMVEQCEAWLRKGVPVMMFPEGTRSEDGQLKAFKDGAFRMSMSTGTPLIPMVLDGTANTLPKHGWVMSASADCTLKILDPISPERFNGDVAAYRDHVHALIRSELEQLRAKPGVTG